ncbi:POPLD domain protein [Dictyocaulus viviparus]|uniref:POPLD domain protein n=1 Tax=Dictyocaulus viviparus TaxID=29172 RepID=A0A0D8XMG0_DICVI|nr:POPLD domain protein [Dictyocaulus viviparus]
MDFWVALQLRTARASGLRDDIAAHLEASRFYFPSDVIDSQSGIEDIKQMQLDHEIKYEKRPHNRRVQYWDQLSIKYPFTFEYVELVNDWSIVKGENSVANLYVLRDRIALLSLQRWIVGKSELPAGLLSSNNGALVPVELHCIHRGKPKRYGLVCLPTVEDLNKASCRYCSFDHEIYNRHRSGPVSIIQEPRKYRRNADSTPEVEFFATPKNVVKDYISIDPSTREKPISLKDLFPDTKVVDRTMKRKLLNKKKKENAKRRRCNQEQRMKKLNTEKEEKEAVTYRESANR